MQETEQLISLYHTAFIVFLILTIVFALISVLIFFQFRIKDVFDFKTGRGQKRTIRQMEEENAKTGKIPAIDNRALKAVTFVFILSGINRFGNGWKMGKEK